MRTYDKSTLETAVKNSSSWAQVHRELGLSISGSSYRILQRNCREHNIDTSHFTGQGWNVGDVNKKYPKWGGKKPLDSILQDGVVYKTARLKKRLVEEGLLEDNCDECGQEAFWNGKPLTLQLDHINGKSDDNRLTNLRILCPNCHTQTPTFGAKNRKPRSSNG